MNTDILQRVHSNRELNKRKGIVMSEGRKLIEAKSGVAVLGKDGTGTTSATPMQMSVRPLISSEDDDKKTPIKTTPTMLGNTTPNYGTMANPYQQHASQMGLANTGDFSAANLYGTANPSLAQPYGSAFTPINAIPMPESMSYNADYTNYANMNNLMSNPSSVVQFPTLSRPFALDDGVHSSLDHMAFGSVQQYPTEFIGSTTPKDTPPRIIFPRSASSSSALTQRNRDKSTESSDSHKGVDISDDDDPEWNPASQSKKKQRR